MIPMKHGRARLVVQLLTLRRQIISEITVLLPTEN